MREGARGVPDGGGKEGRDQIRRHGRREGRSATGEERRAIFWVVSIWKPQCLT
jgi:hypothetical protein